MAKKKETPRVFISYSHDSEEHRDKVLSLSNKLLNDGVDCWIDQYEISPEEGWPNWCLNQIEKSDFTLVICTKTYYDRFRRKAKKNIGQGVKFEGHIIIQDIYDNDSLNKKFIPVCFDEKNKKNVPECIRGGTVYELLNENSYVMLYRHITNQPLVNVV